MNKFFSRNIIDVDGAINYITNNYNKKISYQPFYSSLLSFLYNFSNDKKNELFWIKIFFETFNAPNINYSSLKFNNKNITNMDIVEYINSWRDNYPKVKSIILTNNYGKISEFKNGLNLKVFVSNNTSFTILQNSKIIISDILVKGQNTILLPFDLNFSNKPCFYKLKIPFGNNNIIKTLEFNVRYKVSG